MKSILRLFIGVAMALTIWSSIASAQAVTGSFVGNVTDASGGAVSGAKVTMTEVSTGVTRTATTNEDGGFVFLTTKRISESNGGMTLSETHESSPQTFVAKVSSIPMRLFFKGVVRKYVLQDLNDIKAAVEKE